MLSAKQVRVLVVDDDPIVTEIIRMQLTHLDYMVVGVVFDGLEAVQAAIDLQPDLVLMDLRMADPRTGLEKRLAGLEAAREIQKTRPTPVIILTAYESSELVHEASVAGVVGYLIKPVRSSELERAIIIALARFKDMRELQRQNVDLQIRNKELGVFAEYAAHDLKAPLAPIVGFAETLADKSFSRADMQQYLRRIARSGRKMANVVDELLQLASIRKEDVPVVPLEMADIVAAARERLSDMATEYGAQITVQEHWPVALGHASWIEEAWVNYLSNAIKYGGEPPCIEVGGERQFAMVRFWVRDQGPGLTASEQQRVFTPFERLSQVRARGHGLGLGIVRQIVEKLNGEVGVESVQGEGCTFYFTLPATE
ncbi:MAG: hybrid sensor histidine kinase/response regulator [Chloroflexota bacterium]|nr:hybrid sensor histidine kinase/response regulator [Chloroflexota bacterium]